MSQDILIRSARIVDPSSDHHDNKLDILIRNGKISKIEKEIKARNVLIVEGKGLHVSQGWLDLKAHFRDPGEELKEDIESGLRAAENGGFTSVLVMPSTNPPIDGRSGIEYLLKRADNQAVKLLPSGCISKGLRGEQLAELFDMEQSGAKAFTDDKHPVTNPKLMLTALLYARDLKSKIFSFAHDEQIAANGTVHEGAVSTSLGLKGIPPLAEKLMIERDISLVEYADSSCHFSTISTSYGVEAVRKSKSKGIAVSCDVAAYDLLLIDEELIGFDSNYKVLPPLRDKSHVRALIKGLKNGTIDAICSDHRPEDIEHKDQEFGEAAYGMIGSETAFAVANTALGKVMELKDIISKFTTGPRNVLGLEDPTIEVGKRAELTIFDPKTKWEVTSESLASRSRNTPFLNRTLVGKAIGIINGERSSFTQ